MPRRSHHPSFTIKEASRITKVSRHTLRFWEKALEGVIVPRRTEGGQRRYTPEHLFIIEEVKMLKSQGLSLVRIKDRLNSKYNHTEDNSNSQKIDLLADRISRMVRSAVTNFLEGEEWDKDRA